jgi:myosin heavy subunit
MQISALIPGTTRFTRSLHAFLVLAVAAALTPASADPDRDRAQMMQMQQQLQRLQSDNAAIQKERGELQTKAQEADKLKKTSEQTAKELARARQAASAQAKELASVKAELAATREQLTAQIDSLGKQVAERDTALQLAAEEKRKSESNQVLLQARLKFQTGRGDLCELRHASVMKFSQSLIDRYEGERLRLCEPVTGIWKVKSQSQVQALRDELYGYRLDIPAPAPTAAATAPADSGVAAADR